MEGDDRPWEAIDVPPLLTQLVGDGSNEFRFTDEDISEDITSGELNVIYAP